MHKEYSVGDTVRVIKNNTGNDLIWFGCRGLITGQMSDGKYSIELVTPLSTDIVKVCLSSDYLYPDKSITGDIESYAVVLSHENLIEADEEHVVYSGSDRNYALSFRPDSYFDTVSIHTYKGGEHLSTDTLTEDDNDFIRYWESPSYEC